MSAQAKWKHVCHRAAGDDTRTSERDGPRGSEDAGAKRPDLPQGPDPLVDRSSRLWDLLCPEHCGHPHPVPPGQVVSQALICVRLACPDSHLNIVLLHNSVGTFLGRNPPVLDLEEVRLG